VREKSPVPRPRQRLSDLRLRTRLVLLVLLPLTASVALAAVQVVAENDAIHTEDDLSGQVHVSQSVAGLVHAVQDERDLISLYLSGGQSPTVIKSLSAAENATDAQVKAFQAAQQQYSGAISALSPSAQALAVRAQARLGDLPVLRSSVVSLGDSRPVFQAYTVVIDGLLTYDDQLATGTTDHTLGNLVSTLNLVRQAGEQTSQERGYLAGILGDGGQLREQQEDLIQAQATYNSAYAAFTAQAPAQSVNLYQATVGGQDTGAADIVVQQAIDAALSAHPVGDVGMSDGGAYAAATTKIGQIRAVEVRIGADIQARTGTLLSAARTKMYLNAAVIVFVLLLAFGATAVIARSIVGPLRVLRNSAYEIAAVRLPDVIRRLRDPHEADRQEPVAPIAVHSRDEVGEVARAFDEVHGAAVRLASEQAMLRQNVNAIFMNLSRRSQTLVERQLRLIDDLENSERDGDRLAQLFRLDHLATRMRRNNENLLVLAGEETARRWTEAVRLVDVARAAAAEVEQYERIVFGEMPRVRVSGKAAPDVAHLIAELLENATAFSSPQTKVWVAARTADGGGVLVNIEDVGIGMTNADLERVNARLADPPLVDASVSRQMGLFVVGRLSGRYGIEVRLAQSQAGGISASITIPAQLVSPMPDDAPGFRTLDGPGSRSIDEEFYALSRQLSQGARLGTGEGTGDAFWFEYTPRRSGPAPTEPSPRPARQVNGTSMGAAPAAHQPPTPVRQPPASAQQAPTPAPSPAPAEPAPPAVPQDPLSTAERLPIFEAVESEWFQRRGSQGPHSGWSPRAATPPGGGYPPAPSSPPVSPWSSPGDDGWRAAAALSHPSRDGTTRTGLPKRVPKANLVPGQAGASGAAKAAPPAGLGPSAEAVRKRLSGFRRSSGQGQEGDGRS
jgi:signal transduction histidine kinase